MANVLALYGGVAADSTILNFKSLNVLWNRMLTDGADAVIWLEIDPDVFCIRANASNCFFFQRDTQLFHRNLAINFHWV